MKTNTRTLCASALGLSMMAGSAAAEIIYDAEFKKVQAQYADEWAKEDSALDKRLAELEAKHGKKPNIIYFLWDDAAYGRVGHPMLSKITGMNTPTFDRIAQEGMIFTRMYTEPSCTPTRVATLTGRHPIRSGLTQGGLSGARHRHAPGGGDDCGGAQEAGLQHRLLRQVSRR